ncbi:FGGY-family carbohydrate kinase [Ligilactobacillus agilis]|uniref:FGGY-family carbohydrate kinase n=1 Tax=Ligilactobacillus agilis TaxID=1601 RepID=UPI003F89473F
MADKYILAIDQSTQGTKLLLINQKAEIVWKNSLNHRQIVNNQGWVSHDLNEIKANIITLLKKLLTEYSATEFQAVAITNQRETAAAWSKSSGQALAPAIVWQDSRAQNLVTKIMDPQKASMVKQRTGLQLSPYFSAAKFAWLLKNNAKVQAAAQDNDLAFGTIDTWLLFQLTSGKNYKTEASNACRTQLLNLHTCDWDSDICQLFGIERQQLPQVVDSNDYFGSTDLFGLSNVQIPILSILGDSQAALYAHGCYQPGSFKITFGTGSSVMLNLGSKFPTNIDNQLNTSIAWSRNGQRQYVLEGNINYAGATITWLKDNLQLITSPAETEALALAASSQDETYLIPAFSGLGAPYWLPNIQAAFVGMSRSSGKAELVKASLDSLSYQIADILDEFARQYGQLDNLIHVDGGMIQNHYLMQTLSDFTQKNVVCAQTAELSALGTALNVLNQKPKTNTETHNYQVQMSLEQVNKKRHTWSHWIKKLQ